MKDSRSAVKARAIVWLAMSPYGKAAALLPHTKSFALILEGGTLLLWTAAAMLPLSLNKFRRTERGLQP